MKESTLNKGFGDGGLQGWLNLKLLVILITVLIAGCKAKKQLVVVPKPVENTPKKPDTKALTIGAINAGQTYFDTFSAKARTKLNIGGNSNDVTLNIRIKSNQKIWISITAIAGIEVARALITPDSILLINRLQSLYVKKPFSYINTFAGKEVNYKTIESLLIGNAIHELVNENADLQTVANGFILTGSLNDLVYKLVIGPVMKATQTNLNDHAASQSLQVTNSVFIQSGTRVIPSQIDISSLVKDKKIQVNLHYIKSDFDQPLEYPFSIPSRYQPAK